MFKRVSLFLLVVVLLFGGGYLVREWNHISLSPKAAPWLPPPAPAPARKALPRQPCLHYTDSRQPFFGDLHVHTSVSFDARSLGMMGTPDHAYRFARGEPIGLAPFDSNGNGGRQTRLETPLDFAAVTDHAEWIGEVVNCSDPDSPSYQVEGCAELRGEIPTEGHAFLGIIGVLDRNADVCGPNNSWCRGALKSAWQTNWQATEDHYDRSSDCSFTSFHGYEYSNSISMSKVHRNVIYRNELVPELPVSSLEEPDPVGLWEKMDSLCNARGGDCEAISIPHNPNLANGRMFFLPYKSEPLEEQKRQAKLHARLEPVVEMMQIKGESECSIGLWNVLGEDELCNFEKLRPHGDRAPRDCEDDYGRGAIAGEGCQSRLDFARYALVEGLAEQRRIGINPYRFGLAGSTDTHNANPGDVEEDSYPGCCGESDTNFSDRQGDNFIIAGLPGSFRNPGGLMGVWAEENSRDSLFDAMKRREVFATSGPRITPRFFAGWELPESICQGDVANAGYAGGVPMGGSLSSTGQNSSPLFVATAVADPSSNLLQRVQMIKVWPGDDDAMHQAVFDMAGNADNGAEVDLDTCITRGAGEAQVCATWTDPNFDPQQAAAYYLRIIENPSCRWTWRECIKLPANERPTACSDERLPKSIQERAWGSPIWVTP